MIDYCASYRNQEAIFNAVEFLTNSKIPVFCTTNLLVELPFIANCHTPERTAITNLILYKMSVSECTKRFFYHTEKDDLDVLSRLKPFFAFSDGNKDIIDKGLCLIALQMLSGYQRDIIKDIRKNKYNPLVNKQWQYEKIKSDLIKKIKSVDCSEIDHIMTIKNALFEWWSI